MEEDGGGGDGHAGEAEGALAGLFDEADGASSGASFGGGGHGVGLVEDGGEVVFVEGRGEYGD